MSNVSGQWMMAARRTWTLVILAITSPLMVEPVIQLMEPTVGTPDEVLAPTIRIVGLAVLINFFYALGSLMSIQDLHLPDKKR